MYRITFVRLGNHYYYTGYLGRNPNRGFFTKEFHTIEEAVKFCDRLPTEVYIKSLDNFTKQERIVFNRKRLCVWRHKNSF